MTLAPYNDTKRRLTPDDDDFYPSSDGKPMGETYIHVTLIAETLGILTRFFMDRDDVQIAGNNFIHYEYGNARKHLAPDTYVVFGLTTPIETSYHTWKPGNPPPRVVFEFTSKSTRHEDTFSKRAVYEQVLRVNEYFQFDPTSDYLSPNLQGFRLINGRYVPIAQVNGMLHSDFLGLEMFAEGHALRFYDPHTGVTLPDNIENEMLRKAAVQQADEEKRRADEEKRRADDAMLDNAALLAELVRLRAQLGK